ncbi:hypothetical protein [Streptomyces sp. NPDC020917]|uniref:hypothetical protein n=1 Tax=Streptomyces sp. NPDC020917 TaxID=3365102 RepID=UPI0037AD225B
MRDRARTIAVCLAAAIGALTVALPAQADALDGALYCAGGSTGGASTVKAYTFDPRVGAWSALPDLPFDLWGMAAVGANGKLLLSGGVTANNTTLTNMGTAFDPSTDSWTELPNSNYAVYRGGSACGFYKIGGSTGSFNPVRNTELLPGYGQCGSAADVTWLSEGTTDVTLAPGQSTDITLTLDASGAAITQPGTFAAALKVIHDTPYTITPLPVAMVVKPPSTWGKITGTVTGTVCGGTPAGIKGATVQLDSWAQSFTLKTDTAGRYALWVDARNNPIDMIVAKDGWTPQGTKAKVVKGQTTTKDFTLKPDSPCAYRRRRRQLCGVPTPDSQGRARRRLAPTDGTVLGASVREARRCCAVGDPDEALILGRDLCWASVGDPECEVYANELLVMAYQALGRPTLAGIAGTRPPLP